MEVVRFWIAMNRWKAGMNFKIFGIMGMGKYYMVDGGEFLS